MRYEIDDLRLGARYLLQNYSDSVLYYPTVIGESGMPTSRSTELALPQSVLAMKYLRPESEHGTLVRMIWDFPDNHINV